MTRPHPPDFEDSEAEIAAKHDEKLATDPYAHDAEARVISREPPAPRRDARLWTALLLGPAIWFLALVVAWIVAPAAHITRHTWTLRGIHLVALAIAIGAVVLAVREKRRLPEEDPEDIQIQRARFLSRCALALSLVAVLLIVGMMMPTFLLTPGAEP